MGMYAYRHSSVREYADSEIAGWWDGGIAESRINCGV